ncbi:GNAT family N-acetyltransferase [Actinotalea sp.]|uniref:GNAT family N-acetyltransferase n=1 Tax=Actinotalea sp. TaxID=1872145 RepID=UPI002C630114|nr:GNAT family N-acetyltransferase [Actinotalea sp.]HQY32862.1 GNAT family N-acetyltransferase [Actinotalea sp.]HRA50213.1 GNAT family N-acetyltransferase [Actinotalea sp.]
MSVVVRPALPDDLGRVGALTAHAYLADDLLAHDDDYLHELRDAARRADEATVLVAVEGDHVLGSITLAAPGSPFAEIAAPDEWELRMLAVDPAARGRGVGELLLRAAIESGLADGASAVILSTLPAMAAAQRMYARIGLHRVPSRDWSVEGYSMLVYSTAPPP